MAAVATERTMSVVEFSQWMLRPENKGVRYELVEGLPRQCPVATEPNPWLSVRSVLTRYVFGRKGSSLALRGDGLIMGRNPDTVMTPDLMLFLASNENEEFPKRFTDEVPDLVVEILPSTLSFSRLLQRGERYIPTGRTRMLWLVHPPERAVFVGRGKASLEVFNNDETLTGNGILPNFSCKVAELFALPDTASQPHS